MEIRINGTNIDFQLENEKTAGEILGQLEKACEKDGMTITSIASGGKRFSAEELDAFFSRGIDEIPDIEIETLSGADILLMAKASGERLAGLAEKMREIPVLLQTGKEREAMERLEFFSEEMQRLEKLLPLLPLAGIEEEKLRIEGLNPGEYTAALSPFLEELTEAIEQNDTVTIGDIAEYEVAPRIEAIGGFLSKM